MSGEASENGGSPPRGAHLRLVWTNPSPPPPRGPVNLAIAIERHLAGRDGLSDEQFVKAFARRSR
jgi:hypothetical protein